MIAEWLAPRMHRASGVTLREALKYLDAPPRTAAAQAPAGRTRPRSPAAARSRRRLAG